VPPNLISDFLITNLSPCCDIAGLIEFNEDVGLLLIWILNFFYAL
jgi:hypothetical protein